MTPQETEEFTLKRTLEMKIRFTKDELDALTQKAKRARMSRESFCRQALNGIELKEASPADVPFLIHELRRIGIGIDQLIKSANSISTEETVRLHEVLEQNRATEKLIVETYTTKSN